MAIQHPPIGTNKGYSDSVTASYNSFSGTDITAQIIIPNERQPLHLGELSTISYSIHREQKPVRGLGKVNVKGFVRGARTIAGSMVFTVFDSYPFYRLEQYRNLVYGTRVDSRTMYPLADMLPPFDMVLTFASEYGAFARMKILGMVIVDEGGTFSIENIISEQEFTYMATGIIPLTKFVPEQIASPSTVGPASVTGPLANSITLDELNPGIW